MVENRPKLWRHLVPIKTEKSHKYTHGHALIFGVDELTGATRLAARACARMGAGLVTVLANSKSANIYRTALPAHILVRDDLAWLDDRVTVKLYGPGGVPTAPDFTSEIPTILDADALMKLPEILSNNYILTPHEGEFGRTFSDIKGTRLERAQHVAQKMKCHLVLKGAATVIVAPNGRYVVNHHASPWLATAGTGDVLAGMIAGLVAQDMPIFDACCAAVWLHGECGRQIGMGLVASDIVEIMPSVLQSQCAC